MALSVAIERVVAASEFSAGVKVADIVVSGGISPYSYSLLIGGDYFQIVGTEVQVKSLMDSDNLKPFRIKVTDGDDSIIVSEMIYPDIIQSKFKKESVIYRIVTDIDLNGGTLTIPYGCTLDFQGGKISNGTIHLNSTRVLPNGYNINDYITASRTGSVKSGQMSYDPDLKKMKLWNGTSWVNLDGTALE